MSSENEKKDLTYATKWLHKPEKLSGNALTQISVVKNRYFCHNLDCQHETPGECLFNTIRYLIEHRSTQLDDRDPIWKGCILLWLVRVFPGIVEAADRIPLSAIYDGIHSTRITEADRTMMEDAVDWLESELLPAPLTSLFAGWPPSRTTSRENIMAAQKWLLDQLLNPPKTLSFQLVQQLAERYSQYPLFTLKSPETGKFERLTATPLLLSQEEPTAKNIDQVLERRPGKIYIYGPPGSGKTVLSRYVVWQLSTQHLNKIDLALGSQSENGQSNLPLEDVLPLPFDIRQLDAFADRPTQSGQLKSLAVKQWTAMPQLDERWT